MTYLLLQTFLLLLSAYFLGAFAGCLAKRALGPQRAHVATAGAAPIVVHRAEAAPLVAPRPIELVQPRIEILPRPKPHVVPELLDISRFERALVGPDPNEGMARTMIVEIRPAVLKSPTGPPHPWPPVPPVKPDEDAAAAKVPPADKPKTSPEPKVAAQSQPSTAAKEPVAPKASGAPMATATAAAAAAVSAARAAVGGGSSPPASEVKSEPAAPQVAEKPKPSAAASPSDTGGDDLQSIRAIDAVTEQRLRSIGISRFAQIALWTGDDIDRIAAEFKLGSRIDQEQWIEQAQILAKGGDTYYSRSRAAARSDARPEAETPPPSKPAVEPAKVTVAPSRGQSVPSVGVPATKAPSGAGEGGIEKTAPDAAAKPQQTEVDVSGSRQGRTVAQMADATAAAIAAASASVTRGIRPIEPISPLTRADPKIVMPARLTDALKAQDEKGTHEAKPVSASTEGAQPTPSAKPAAGGKSDDLKRIRGIGVLIERQLAAIGVTRYQQIANWSSSDIEAISAKLDFKGRIERENWVEQARILSSGGETEFSRRVDRGDVET